MRLDLSEHWQFNAPHISKWNCGGGVCVCVWGGGGGGGGGGDNLVPKYTKWFGYATQLTWPTCVTWNRTEDYNFPRSKVRYLGHQVEKYVKFKYS